MPSNNQCNSIDLGVRWTDPGWDTERKLGGRQGLERGGEGDDEATANER